MEEDTLQEAERRAALKGPAMEAALRHAGVPVVGRGLTEVEERHLTGIPVLDEDDEAWPLARPRRGRAEMLPYEGPPPVRTKAEQAVIDLRFTARGTAPVSAQGRVALAKELLRRAVSELQAVHGHGVSKALEARASSAALRVRSVYAELDEAEDEK